MSKSKADPPNQPERLPGETDEEPESVPIIPIRTETVLSQYPLHQLGKKANPEIKVTRANAKGQIISTWEVSPSRKYGEPGPLAYKLDSLLVSRAIDEARPHIPEIIRLGSLREICEALRLGADTNLVKKALLQNASAFITAKLRYRGVDRTERTFEFGATRYEVIFVGQKLPNGHKADAVYIVLHRTFREFLAQAKTRPLDYEYLKALPPAAQRLYELISFQVFAALKHGNDRARYLYSEFCKFAPLTRYEEWDKVKKQLYKIHKPHKDSGYLSKIEFEETTDEEGRPDWIMWYTPGRKARREYQEFTTKRLERSSTRPGLVSLLEKREGQLSLADRLIAEGVAEAAARELVESYSGEVERQLEALPYRERVKDRAAYLVRAIRDSYALPSDLEEKKARAGKQRQSKRARAEQRAREEHRERHARSFFNYLRGEIERLEETDQESLGEFYDHFGGLEPVTKQMKSGSKEAFMLTEFEDFVGDRPGLKVLTFWQWDEHLNRKPFRSEND